MYDNDESVFMEHEKEEKPKRVACHICHGMAVIERPNGDTVDCPNPKCNNGYIETTKG